MVRLEVFNQFQMLREEALKKGYDIIIDSGFRSYEYQEDVWNKYFKDNIESLKLENPDLTEEEIIKKATILTDQFVARPGTSEHQTGLAFDFAVMKDGKYYEDNIEEVIKWMSENAY